MFFRKKTSTPKFEAPYVREIDVEQLEDLERKIGEVSRETGLVGLRVVRMDSWSNGVFQPGQYELVAPGRSYGSGPFWDTWSALNGIKLGASLMKEQR